MNSFEELYKNMVKGTKFDYPNSEYDLQKELNDNFNKVSALNLNINEKLELDGNEYVISSVKMEILSNGNTTYNIVARKIEHSQMVNFNIEFI